MAGALTFKIEVFHENTEILPQLQAKVKDLSMFFQDVIKEWARGNIEKFGAASGQSLVGAEIDPTVSWKALSPGYFKYKNRLYPDQIMVRTGSLKNALTDPDGFFKMVEPEQAMFGTPNDPEDVMKMQFNWNTRQVIFLSDADQNMIRAKLAQFFVVQTKSIKHEAVQLDADFAATVAA